MNDEKGRLVVIIIVTLIVIGCLGLAFGFYLQFEALIRSGALEAITGENVSGPMDLIGRRVWGFSLVLLGIAFVLWLVRQIRTQGIFAPFTETPTEKLVEVIFAITGVGILLIPKDNPLDNWTSGLLAAVHFLFVGTRILMKPQDEEWRKGEVRGYIAIGALGMILIFAQLFLLFYG